MHAAASPGHRVVVDVGLAAVVGAACGVSSAVFLRGLDAVTAWRAAHPALVWLLPFAAALLLVVVDRVAGEARLGTALVLWRATTGQGGPVPLRLWPLALLGTWWTHLFGGSAGREGTALQMGGAVADFVVSRTRAYVRLDDEDRRRLLLAGIAGGFGSVFGTPIAGAVFAVEVIVAGRVEVVRIAPALVAALVGDAVGDGALHALGGAHGSWPVVDAVAPTARTLAVDAAFGLACGLVAVGFLALTGGVKQLAARARPVVRGLAAGVIVVAVSRVVGDAPLGLSLPSLSAAFAGADVGALFFWKLVLTAVTVGAGLIGGEVTPLFVVGATFGALLSLSLGMPPALAAACGMTAVFGAAAQTPLAVIVMAVELCGGGALVHAAVVVVAATVVVRAARRSLYERLPSTLHTPAAASANSAAAAATPSGEPTTSPP